MQLHLPMRARDPDEAHRAATPLELLFDLSFVVAVAQAASSLHHELVDGHVQTALLGFPLVFFGVWWAWMNFTWFASAYDTDDAAYRLAVLVQISGVLVFAAGVPRAFEHGDYTIGVLGYVVMRLAIVAQWLRAAASHPEGRSCALRYATGIAVLQAGWAARLALPDAPGLVAFLLLAVAEMLVPAWGEAAGRTSWHPRHIAERYGLFTLIVLGESLLSATIGVQVALDGVGTFGQLATVVVGGLLTVFSMWWLYFDMPAERAMEAVRQSYSDRLSGGFIWGYGHYFVFAGAAAAGAGLAVAVDQATHHSRLTGFQAGLAITVPVAIYLLAVWALHAPYKAPSRLRNFGVPVTAAIILACSATPEPVLATGLTLAALVAFSLRVRQPVLTPT
jgi:low temperature requirement protein LtrA